MQLHVSALLMHITPLLSWHYEIVGFPHSATSRRNTVSGRSRSKDRRAIVVARTTTNQNWTQLPSADSRLDHCIGHPDLAAGRLLDQPDVDQEAHVLAKAMPSTLIQVPSAEGQNSGMRWFMAYIVALLNLRAMMRRQRCDLYGDDSPRRD
jgi:hypothetical protein